MSSVQDRMKFTFEEGSRHSAISKNEFRIHVCKVPDHHYVKKKIHQIRKLPFPFATLPGLLIYLYLESIKLLSMRPLGSTRVCKPDCHLQKQQEDFFLQR